MIPKRIHYCWFGGNEKSALILRCIDSWKHLLPDYEIVEWNETNFDLTFSPFALAAYDEKKWAFVSDVARLKIVYDHGGIYLDTDVELFSSMSDRYLENNAFFFFDNIEYLNTGIGFGAEANSPIIRKLLEDYNERKFDFNNLKQLACPHLNTLTLQQAFPNLLLNDTSQVIDNTAFLSQAEYGTFAKHYGAFSWRSEEQDYALKYARKRKHVSRFRKMLRESSLLSYLETHKLQRIKKVYIFLVYDLFDYGLLYWIVKIMQKLLGK